MAKKPVDHVPAKPRPVMWDDDDRSVKKKSIDNEARLSKVVGFKLTPGSGNQHWPGGKGDGSHPLFMFELKETKHSSLSIKAPDIAKVNKEACTVGKVPAIILSAYGIPDPHPKDWVAVPAETFAWMLSQLEES